MKLHLVSLDRAAIAEANKLFGPAVTYTCGDIVSVPRDGAAFVSPANSLGVMDGGIDMVLSREMFVGCEKRLRVAIAALGHKTKLGRPYLRVGSATWFMVDRAPAGALQVLSPLTGGPATGFIAAPTMFVPHDVSDTQNAYWAFLATLVAMDRIEKASGGVVNTLVCTSLCCGVGRMNPKESARQMFRAWNDFHAGRIPAEVEYIGPQYVLLPIRDDQQIS
jgi:O-acetyl-ADP-ribose deacetylase (regulator of RNase III)